MAAAARRGTMVLNGTSGRVYNVNVYVSDVAAAFVTFNANGQAGTGSPSQFIVPEDCVLADISLASGLTDTTLITLQADNATVPGMVIQYADYLNSITTRPSINLGIRAKTQIAWLQA